VNPTALCFWGFASGIGYLIGDGRGALVGLVVAMGLSLLAEFVPGRRR
jgi:hypothetical protein